MKKYIAAIIAALTLTFTACVGEPETETECAVAIYPGAHTQGCITCGEMIWSGGDPADLCPDAVVPYDDLMTCFYNEAVVGCPYEWGVRLELACLTNIGKAPNCWPFYQACRGPSGEEE
ncbi:hypothetical protein [Polyangium sp. 15x6]|uniref:hypothetical protein n=1 Tax=Polyangium sp. 15x6 TaxID=3042687 RepID=UPI00249CC260|nr:hypothetical protein [Polyangium sp. 15x6]MDI3282093.1 hypothetical protein [Polyangium sp. 15x6]